MGKTSSLSRRGVVRLISFNVALIVALTAGTITGYTAARRHRTTIEYTYQRALGELTDYLGNLDITLEKGQIRLHGQSAAGPFLQAVAGGRLCQGNAGAASR